MVKGTLEVGKVADFVVLSADPFAADIEDLDELSVVETIRGGRSIYKADDKPKKVGAYTLPELPLIQWDNDAERSPARGIYACAPLPGACGCSGWTLGHLIAMGRREVASTGP